MIVELNIKDFAIIDDLKINFTEGFNVLTGETGAGKSIIIEGIDMILGQRASKELIRTGKERAILEGLFYMENPARINEILRGYGIEIDPSNYLLISREICKSGPSISRINGRTVTLAMLNAITPYLMDIHGQHEHQSLLNIENHLALIDNLGDEKQRSMLTEVAINHKKLIEEKNRLKELSLDGVEMDREMDLLRYQIEEIDSVDFSKHDEDKLIKEYNKISNIKEIGFALGEVVDIINGDSYNSISLLGGIDRSISILNNIKKFDDILREYYDSFESVGFEMQDLYKCIKDYIENLIIDEERLKSLEDLLNTINRLKKKYGNSIDDILNYRNMINRRLQKLSNIEEEIEKHKNAIKSIEELLNTQCNELTRMRKSVSDKIEALIAKELKDLDMNNVVFEINFEKLENFTSRGKDRLEFLISTNKGEETKPLSKIASGGEMSRIMLAFKSILADYDDIPSLIFDEIDVGISGRTAQVVGEKIKVISNNHQIICVTHLPQIAALADTHFVIDKHLVNGKTCTNVTKLNEEDRIDELSRLLGGVDLTDTTRLHAKEMLEMSKQLKVKMK